jgi:hypothetical protein
MLCKSKTTRRSEYLQRARKKAATLRGIDGRIVFARTRILQGMPIARLLQPGFGRAARPDALGLALVVGDQRRQYGDSMNRMIRIAALAVFVLIPLAATAADITPQPPTQPPPTEAPKPEELPSRDPGIVKQPETVPHPDSVVTPPVVDPRMAVNPEEPQPEPKEGGQLAPAPEQPSRPPVQPR